VVTALREYRGTVDLVLVAPDSVIGIVALVYGSWALICHQPLTGSLAKNGVRIRRVAQNALADELTKLVPDIEPAQSMPITLPPDDIDRDLLESVGDVLPELTGSGQLGATRRSGVRAGPELSWLDGPRGRVQVNRTADGWMSVNPLRHSEVRSRLHELAVIARREHDGS
jgi:hypothetical protein